MFNNYNFKNNKVTGYFGLCQIASFLITLACNVLAHTAKKATFIFFLKPIAAFYCSL